jgi:hypothetical protein
MPRSPRAYFAAFLVLASLVAGCALQTLDQALPQLHGKNIRAAIDLLGYPDQRLEVAGETVYIWNTVSTTSYLQPVTTHSTGTASAFGQGGYAFGSTSGTSTTYVPQTSTSQCTLKIVVDRKDLITGANYSTDADGGFTCEPYARRLEHLVPQDAPSVTPTAKKP